MRCLLTILVVAASLLHVAADLSCAAEPSGEAHTVRQVAPRPTLTIWFTRVGTDAAACCRLSNDLRDNPEFAKQLHDHYHWTWKCGDDDPVRRTLANVSRYPTVFGPSFRLVGYSTPEDLLRRLGIEPLQPPPIVKWPIHEHQQGRSAVTDAVPIAVPPADGRVDTLIEQTKSTSEKLSQIERLLIGTTKPEDITALQVQVIGEGIKTRKHVSGLIDGIGDRLTQLPGTFKTDLIDLTTPVLRKPNEPEAPAESTTSPARNVIRTVFSVGGLVARFFPATAPIAGVIDLASGAIGMLSGLGIFRRFRRPPRVPLPVPPRQSPVRPIPVPPPAPAGAMPTTNRIQFVLDGLPNLPADYSKAFADHWAHLGKSPQMAAEEFDLVRQAFEALRDGQLDIGIQNPKQLYHQAKRWVDAQFRNHAKRRYDDNNIYDRALYTSLWKQVLDSIRSGLLGHWEPQPEIADAIQGWVDERFVDAQLKQTQEL